MQIFITADVYRKDFMFDVKITKDIVSFSRGTFVIILPEKHWLTPFACHLSLIQ